MEGAMKAIKVNSNCIGCGSSVGINPDVFEFNDTGLATVKDNINLQEIDNESVVYASEACPVSAIEIEED